MAAGADEIDMVIDRGAFLAGRYMDVFDEIRAVETVGLVARHELVELRRTADGHVQAVLRHGAHPLEVSRRCVSQLRETLQHL